MGAVKQVCVRCQREGERGFRETPEGPVCSAQTACDRRIEEARLATGLHRIEKQGKNGPYHYYKLDGKRVPGVTGIIKATVPAPRLVDWAARVTARYAADHLDTLWGMRHLGADKIFAVLESEPRAQRDSAGERGTQLHKWAESMIHGQKVEGISSELLPWVLAMRDYIETMRPRPVLMEAPVGSRRHNYAGTLDSVSDFPDGQRRIVDYKSSRGVYSEVALQLAGYRGADVYLDPDGNEQAMADLGISEEGYVVHIRPEGFKVHPVYVGPEAFQAFARLRWVRDLLKYEGELDSWLGDPLPVAR